MKMARPKSKLIFNAKPEMCSNCDSVIAIGKTPKERIIAVDFLPARVTRVGVPRANSFLVVNKAGEVFNAIRSADIVAETVFKLHVCDKKGEE
jgi:hypothetical protein